MAPGQAGDVGGLTECCGLLGAWYEALPMPEGETGWGVFWTGSRMEIERDDEVGRFPTDAEAVQHVTARALAGDWKAITALALHWAEQLDSMGLAETAGWRGLTGV